jgi:hypothetical protein
VWAGLARGRVTLLNIKSVLKLLGQKKARLLQADELEL